MFDTNALIFAVSDPRKLSRKAKSAIARADAVYLSAASLWEIALKAAKGKMPDGARAYHRAAIELGVQVLGIEAEDIHALELVADFAHADPFDRLIVACARRRMLPLVSCDLRIRGYLSNTIW